MKLSEGDQELVGLVACGRTDDEIATQLQIPKYKVLNQIARLLAKLGAQNRVEIVLTHIATLRCTSGSALRLSIGLRKTPGADSRGEVESQLTLAVVAHVLLFLETDPCPERSAGASVGYPIRQPAFVKFQAGKRREVETIALTTSRTLRESAQQEATALTFVRPSRLHAFSRPGISRKLVAESGTYARSGAPLGTWIGLQEQEYMRYGLPALTGFRLHPGSLRLGVFESYLITSALIRWYIVGSLYAYKTIFHPVLSTKLCEQSGNLVQDLVLGNLQLRGNLIVRTGRRRRGPTELLVSFGQLHCAPLLFFSSYIHIATLSVFLRRICD